MRMNSPDLEKLQLEFQEFLEARLSNRALLNDDVKHAIRMSAVTGNYYPIYSEQKTVVGYIVWANVVKETVARLHRSARYPFFIHEWNEGKITMIIDVFLGSDCGLHGLIQLRRFFKSRKAIAYTKGHKKRIFVKKRGKLKSCLIGRTE